MSDSTNRFIITKGLDNTFYFTIKANGSTLPMEIESGDTFTAHIKKLSDGSTVISKALSVDDALSGKVQLVLTSADTDLLDTNRGPEVDRYYVKPEYRLLLDCSTANNGSFIAKVSEVYID